MFGTSVTRNERHLERHNTTRLRAIDCECRYHGREDAIEVAKSLSSEERHSCLDFYDEILNCVRLKRAPFDSDSILAELPEWARKLVAEARLSTNFARRHRRNIERSPDTESLLDMAEKRYTTELVRLLGFGKSVVSVRFYPHDHYKTVIRFHQTNVLMLHGGVWRINEYGLREAARSPTFFSTGLCPVCVADGDNKRFRVLRTHMRSKPHYDRFCYQLLGAVEKLSLTQNLGPKNKRGLDSLQKMGENTSYE